MKYFKIRSNHFNFLDLPATVESDTESVVDATEDQLVLEAYNTSSVYSIKELMATCLDTSADDFEVEEIPEDLLPYYL